MSFDDVVNDLPPVPVEDDNRHVLRDEPHSRESAAFMFALPEHGIGGFLYPWVHANGTGSAAVWAFGPGVGEPIRDRFDDAPIPAEMDFRDWRVQGFQMRLGEPHKSIDLSFQGARISIDCHYEALHPAYAFSSHKDGCPPYYADDRTEQHGIVTGELIIDGKAYALDTFMQRDHSWGTRIWALNQHYKWYHATTAESGVHFFEMHSFGKVLLRGFVFREGRMAEIATVDYDFEFDEDMHQKSFDVMVTDALGRRTWVTAKIFAKTEYHPDPMIILKEGATTVEIDGVAGTGWCEFCWNKNYLEFAKPLASRFAR